MIVAINKTVTDNILQEPQAYIELKQNYLTEFVESYKEWYSSPRYSRVQDQKKKANIAAMALINSDLMQFGYEEQVNMKKEVKDIFETCSEGVFEGKDKRKCYVLPENKSWKKDQTDKLLRGYSFNMKRHPLKYLKKLTFSVRNNKNLFEDTDRVHNLANVGYTYQKKGVISREEDIKVDFSKAIYPTFSVHKNGDPEVDNEDVLNMIHSLKLESLEVKSIGSAYDPDYK